MRKVVTALVIFQIFIITGWAQSPDTKGYHEYRYRLVKTFEDGNGPQALSYATRSGAAQNVFGPTGLRYISRGKWQILDRGNGRLVWLDEKFNIIQTQPSSIEAYSYLSSSGDFALTFYYGGEEIGLTVVATDNIGNRIFVISDEKIKVRQAFSIFNEGAIFVQTEKKEWLSLPFSTKGLSPEFEQRLWDPQKTSSELKQGGEWGKKGFSINSDGNLLYKGLVIGTRYDVFLSVFEGLRRFYSKNDKSDLYPAGRYLDDQRFNLSYLGVDSNKNAYWSMGANEALVFDSTGNMIETFVARGYSANSNLKLHPSGTMYQSGAYAKFFAVDNVWDARAEKLWQQGIDPPKPLADVSLGTFQIPVGLWWQGKLNESNVRIRALPNLNGDIIGSINKGTTVTILETTPEKMKIDKMEAPWFLVRTWEGVQGWVFGAFVDIQK
jgi:hypothetical protein